MDYIQKNATNISDFVLETDSYAFFKSFALHRQYSVYFPFEQFLSFYAFFLTVIGTIFNITSFCIMIRKNIRKYACMRYLAVLSLVDLVVLYQWNLNTFFKYNLSVAPEFKDLEEISLFWCRFISFMAFFSLQLSSWILSLVSFDRVMILYSQYWKIHMQKPRKINTILLLMFITIFCINIHILFKNGYVEDHNRKILLPNGTQVSSTIIEHSVVCYKSKHNRNYIFPNYQRIHLVLYNLIPFAIMLCCNSLICYNVTIARKRFSATVKSKTSTQKIRRMTFMLFLVTFSFMILTLPSVIVHSFLREFLIDKPYRRVVNCIVNNLMHTSHACNFLLYVYSAPNFRAELRMLDQCTHTRKNSSTFTTVKANKRGNSVVAKIQLVPRKTPKKKKKTDKYNYNKDNNNKEEELKAQSSAPLVNQKITPHDPADEDLSFIDRSRID